MLTSIASINATITTPASIKSSFEAGQNTKMQLAKAVCVKNLCGGH